MSDDTFRGVPARWTSSRKSGFGTALGGESLVWFTLAHGILNELYFPTIDHANTRDVGFLVAADDGFFSEEKRDTDHEISLLEDGVPAYRVVNTCERGRYRITKTIFTDPRRPTLVMRVRFEALQGRRGDYRLYLLAAPHLANQGAGNHASLADDRGVPLLCAERDHVALAIGSSIGWRARSCGYVGGDDGWQQVRHHGRLVDCRVDAPDGNVALTGELDPAANDGEFVIAIGFGDSPSVAAYHVRATLFSDPEETLKEYVEGWRNYQRQSAALAAPMREAVDVYRLSVAILRTHESKRFHGAIIASLSLPWGSRRGDGELGGYHLVWPRDQFHAAIALLAAGHPLAARQTLFHLLCTQEPGGNWPQNMWVDGRAYWHANQSDQTASFLLLVEALRHHGGFGAVDPWNAVCRAAECLLRNGPVTEQDRWEENSGYTPYTLGSIIAGLLAAAEFADERDHPDLARRCREAADAWNDSIERWLYVTDTPLARQVGVEGYYVRLSPPGTESPADLSRLTVTLRNHPTEADGRFTPAEIVSPDALALVRFGLRRGDDPRILNTVRVIDATLRRDTASGPVWKRFTHDGYGEPDNGDAFTGAGVGRGWPLFTGERAHYELARGDRAEAEKLMHVMLAQSHHLGGLFPEQIWDAPDIPEKHLYNGQPTGSAMPLVWAHAEFVTLLRSLRDNAVFDLPRAAARRYVRGK